MKIDGHIHYNTMRTDLLEYGAKKNIRFLSIITEVPEFPSIEEQLKTVVELKKTYGNRLNFATTFSCQNWGSDKWLKSNLETIKKSIALGAVGVKIWKNIGMSLKDADGKYVMIDHPSFEPLFQFLEENNILVLGHNGEPKNCWLPMQEMTVESDRDYFTAHPEYYMYLHPEIPNYEAQLRARDSMLKRHSKLRFVGLHLASLEWDVDKVAIWLDRFPTTMVDVAERIVHIQYQTLFDWQKVFNFFIEYQDRIIYGTDIILNNILDNNGLNQYLDERYHLDWTFFAENEPMSVPEVQGVFKGLGLPQEILQKIYHSNAVNTYNI